MLRSRRVSLALVGLLLGSSACTKWVPIEPPYTPSLGSQGSLRVTDERGVQVLLEQPLLNADSIWGTDVSSYWERGDLKHRRVAAAIPMESVRMIEVRRSDTLATVGLVVGIAAGLTAIAAAAGAYSTEFDLSEGSGE